MKRVLILFIFSGIVLLALVLIGGKETEVEARPNQLFSAPVADVSIVYVSGNEGTIFPQPDDDLGGLARCGSLLDKLKTTQNALILSNGNQSERMKMKESELYISFWDLLQVDALSIGPGDFKIRSLMPEAFENEVATVNCNIVRNGKRLFPDKVIQHMSSAGVLLKVAIIGIISQKFEPIVKAYAPDLEVMDVEQSLDRTLRQLPSGISLIILLAHVPTKNAAVKVAKRWPNIDILLFEAPGLNALSKPIRIGQTFITNSGFGISHTLSFKIELRKNKKGIKHLESSRIPVSAEVPDFPELFELIKGYQTSFLPENEPQFAGEQEPNTTHQNPNTYVGSMVCGECHKYEFDIWAKSRHAVPFKMEHPQPASCLECHSTGFGFTTLPNHNIGCEACHGPGKQHSVNPKSRGFNSLPVAVCYTCHTSIQSPTFSYFTSWSQINH